MKRHALIACSIVLAGACLAGEHEDAARRLIQTTGEAERAAQSLKEHLLKSVGEKPDGILKEAVTSSVSELSGKDVEDLLYKVYVRHFTTAELTELTRFAESPLGRKLFEKQYVIFKDGKDAIMYLGKQTSHRAARKAVEAHGEDAVRKEMNETRASNKTGGR
jgi:hypothetical protein